MSKTKRTDFPIRIVGDFSRLDVAELSRAHHDELTDLLGRKVEIRNWVVRVRHLVSDAALFDALPDYAELIDYYETVASQAKTLAGLLRRPSDDVVTSARLIRDHVVSHLNIYLIHDPEKDIPVWRIIELLDIITTSGAEWAKRWKRVDKPRRGGPKPRIEFKEFLRGIIDDARRAGDDLTLPGEGGTNPLSRYISRAVRLAVASALVALEEVPLGEEEKRIAQVRLRGYLPRQRNRALIDASRACVAELSGPRRRRVKA